jgi:hypothetical protein
MKKLALGLATAGTFAAITVGLATPAFAATAHITSVHDAVYSTQTHTATVQPVDCHVSVNNGGTNVDVNWC